MKVKVKLRENSVIVLEICCNSRVSLLTYVIQVLRKKKRVKGWRSVWIECPGKPDLLPVCLLICRVFWFLCSRFGFSQFSTLALFLSRKLCDCLLICCVLFCFFFGGDTQKKLHLKKSYTATPKKSYTATPKKSDTTTSKNNGLWPWRRRLRCWGQQRWRRGRCPRQWSREGGKGAACAARLDGEEHRMKIGVRALSPPLR